MRLLSATAGACLTVCLLGNLANAATATATFEGVTNQGFGSFFGTAPTAHTLVISGSDAVPGTPVASIPEFFELGTGTASFYSFGTMTYGLPDLGRSFTTTSAVGYIGNNVSRGGDVVDGIYAVGSFMDGAISGTIEYFAAFAPDRFSSTALSEAISAGIASALTISEGAGVTLVENGMTSQTFGAISVTDVFFTQDPDPDPGNGGGGTGGGGGMPDLTPVPLPASGLLLLGGLAAFGAMRRKRV